MKTMEEKRIEARFLTRSISGVGGLAKAPRWGIG